MLSRNHRMTTVLRSTRNIMGLGVPFLGPDATNTMRLILFPGDAEWRILNFQLDSSDDQDDVGKSNVQQINKEHTELRPIANGRNVFRIVRKTEVDFSATRQKLDSSRGCARLTNWDQKSFLLPQDKINPSRRGRCRGNRRSSRRPGVQSEHQWG